MAKPSLFTHLGPEPISLFRKGLGSVQGTHPLPKRRDANALGVGYRRCREQGRINGASKGATADGGFVKTKRRHGHEQQGNGGVRVEACAKVARHRPERYGSAMLPQWPICGARDGLNGNILRESFAS
ncbi:hypothetical protein E2542_SST27369 [Spatholobus suberectus]|nr:hypothetical protein E2542_SST27369 [Spatholobus suberectus]